MKVVQKMSNLKPIISMSQACKMMNLNGARFYQLLDQGVFPPPIYQIKTKRPFYDTRLQQELLKIRETGVGANGQIILFYSPRKRATDKPKKPKTIDSTVLPYQEFAETLNDMGFDCSAKEVGSAIAQLYPDGFENVDEGVVIRELFRFLKSTERST
jgi:hypothetical protein